MRKSKNHVCAQILFVTTDFLREDIAGKHAVGMLSSAVRRMVRTLRKKIVAVKLRQHLARDGTADAQKTIIVTRKIQRTRNLVVIPDQNEYAIQMVSSGNLPLVNVVSIIALINIATTPLPFRNIQTRVVLTLKQLIALRVSIHQYHRVVGVGLTSARVTNIATKKLFIPLILQVAKLYQTITHAKIRIVHACILPKNAITRTLSTKLFSL